MWKLSIFLSTKKPNENKTQKPKSKQTKNLKENKCVYLSTRRDSKPNLYPCSFIVSLYLPFCKKKKKKMNDSGLDNDMTSSISMNCLASWNGCNLTSEAPKGRVRHERSLLCSHLKICCLRRILRGKSWKVSCDSND